jgi:hypothetical protein
LTTRGCTLLWILPAVSDAFIPAASGGVFCGFNKKKVRELVCLKGGFFSWGFSMPKNFLLKDIPHKENLFQVMKSVFRTHI